MSNTFYAYIRVSTAKQGEGVSLEAQQDAIKSYAAQHGFQISRWFEEKETAAKIGRPKFTELVKELKSGKARGVIMHKIDRSARNLRDWAAVGELQDSGIEVHFAAENVDFTTNGGRLTADIHAVMAAHYIRNLREETLKGINGRLKQGLYPFKAPIGYLDTGGGKAKVICPKNGPKVRHLFECYASGEYSLWTLVDEAERIGLKSSRGGRLSKTAIEWMLKNPFYTGLIHVKSRAQTFKGIHEPLISPALFQKVTEVRHGKKAQKKSRHDLTYRRMFTCAECNRSYIGERQKGHKYYRCHTKGCASQPVREEALETAVQRLFDTFSFQGIELAALQTHMSRWAEGVLRPEPENSKEAELAQLKAKQTKLLDALLDGLIDKETFETRKAEFLLQEQALSKKDEKRLTSSEFARHLTDLLELLQSLTQTYNLAIAREKRQILKILSSNRKVAGRNVEIEPRNWLPYVSECVSGLFGPHYTPDPRTMQHVRFSEPKALNDFFMSQDWNELRELHNDLRGKGRDRSLPETEHAAPYKEAA